MSDAVDDQSAGETVPADALWCQKCSYLANDDGIATELVRQSGLNTCYRCKDIISPAALVARAITS